ncbi:hypothetical protein [Pseudomonas sp. BF-R-01]|uniref:hypothetical protein n=1 Tax=Pseudomonas sp. BF-R-01 TaxID=2832365 RepID=UPI001CBAD324|nr:hypothetical protein [Pseudomonas sp. BF-R-01]
MARGWTALIAILGTVAGGFAGFFFAIHMNPETADRYVLDLGSVGEWVSGIGALVAVVTAILLADQQRKDNAERLVLNCQLMTADDATAIYGARDVVVEIVSAGNRPSRIKGAKIWATPGESGHRIYYAGPAGKGFPLELNYGETLDIRLEHRRAMEVCEYFNSRHEGDFSNAKMTVFTTLGSHDIDLSSQLREWKAMQEQKSRN